MSIKHSDQSQLEIICLPALSDNYIWLIRRDQSVAVVDPGESQGVEEYVSSHDLEITSILITHHHPDHTGGLKALLAKREIPVYGPAADSIAGVNVKVAEGDTVELPAQQLSFKVMEVPGHTTTHIAFYAPGLLFPGDTIFCAGCGRLFGGTAEQLYHSLEKFKKLPDDTRVYAAHEYTLANLRFAQAADPDNSDRDEWLNHCKTLREEGMPTLPTTMGVERRINPFLRAGEPQVMENIARSRGKRPADALASFTELRAWKDSF